MKKGLKVIAAATVVCFLTTQIAWGAPGANIEIASKRELPTYLSIDVPVDLGTVDALYEAPASTAPQFILHIQNAHANYQAQMKIKQLLEHMNKKYGFTTIFVEGASTKLDADYLRLFPDEERNLKLCDELAKQGELTGSELFLMENEKNVEALGIEQAPLYKANYEALKKVFGAEPDVNRFFQGFDQKLDRAASKVFTPETRALIADWKRFELGRREFMPFVQQLAKQSRRILDVDLNSLFAQAGWPQITRLLAIQEMEKSLDKAKGLEEKAALLKMLKTKGVSKELLAALESFNEGSISVGKSAQEVSPRDVLERLAAEVAPKGFKFSDYPAFSLFAGYVTLRAELDPKVLFAEIEYLFTQMLDALAKEPQQKALLALYRDGELLRKLLHLELSRTQWRELVDAGDRVTVTNLVERLKTAIIAAGDTSVRKDQEVMPKAFSGKMTELFKTGLEFYGFARQREGVFYKEMQNAMSQRKITKAVLITGGFHTDGMSDLFRENSVSYGIVTPRLSEKSDERLYRSTMLQDGKQNFELSFVEKTLLAQPLKGPVGQDAQGVGELGVLGKLLATATKVAEVPTPAGILPDVNDGPMARRNELRLVQAKEGGETYRVLRKVSPDQVGIDGATAIVDDTIAVQMGQILPEMLAPTLDKGNEIAAASLRDLGSEDPAVRQAAIEKLNAIYTPEKVNELMRLLAINGGKSEDQKRELPQTAQSPWLLQDERTNFAHHLLQDRLFSINERETLAKRMLAEWKIPDLTSGKFDFSKISMVYFQPAWKDSIVLGGVAIALAAAGLAFLTTGVSLAVILGVGVVAGAVSAARWIRNRNERASLSKSIFPDGPATRMKSPEIPTGDMNLLKMGPVAGGVIQDDRDVGTPRAEKRGEVDAVIDGRDYRGPKQVDNLDGVREAVARLVELNPSARVFLIMGGDTAEQPVNYSGPESLTNALAAVNGKGPFVVQIRPSRFGNPAILVTYTRAEKRMTRAQKEEKIAAELNNIIATRPLEPGLTQEIRDFLAVMPVLTDVTLMRSLSALGVRLGMNFFTALGLGVEETAPVVKSPIYISRGLQSILLAVSLAFGAVLSARAFTTNEVPVGTQLVSFGKGETTEASPRMNFLEKTPTGVLAGWTMGTSSDITNMVFYIVANNRLTDTNGWAVVSRGFQATPQTPSYTIMTNAFLNSPTLFAGIIGGTNGFLNAAGRKELRGTQLENIPRVVNTLWTLTARGNKGRRTSVALRIFGFGDSDLVGKDPIFEGNYSGDDQMLTKNSLNLGELAQFKLQMDLPDSIPETMEKTYSVSMKDNAIEIRPLFSVPVTLAGRQEKRATQLAGEQKIVFTEKQVADLAKFLQVDADQVRVQIGQIAEALTQAQQTNNVAEQSRLEAVLAKYPVVQYEDGKKGGSLGRFLTDEEFQGVNAVLMEVRHRKTPIILRATTATSNATITVAGVLWILKPLSLPASRQEKRAEETTGVNPQTPVNGLRAWFAFNRASALATGSALNVLEQAWEAYNKEVTLARGQAEAYKKIAALTLSGMKSFFTEQTGRQPKTAEPRITQADVDEAYDLFVSSLRSERRGADLRADLESFQIRRAFERVQLAAEIESSSFRNAAEESPEKIKISKIQDALDSAMGQYSKWLEEQKRLGTPANMDLATLKTQCFDPKRIKDAAILEETFARVVEAYAKDPMGMDFKPTPVEIESAFHRAVLTQAVERDKNVWNVLQAAWEAYHQRQGVMVRATGKIPKMSANPDLTRLWELLFAPQVDDDGRITVAVAERAFNAFAFSIRAEKRGEKKDFMTIGTSLGANIAAGATSIAGLVYPFISGVLAGVTGIFIMPLIVAATLAIPSLAVIYDQISYYVSGEAARVAERRQVNLANAALNPAMSVAMQAEQAREDREAGIRGSLETASWMLALIPAFFFLQALAAAVGTLAVLPTIAVFLLIAAGSTTVIRAVLKFVWSAVYQSSLEEPSVSPLSEKTMQVIRGGSLALSAGVSVAAAVAFANASLGIPVYALAVGGIALFLPLAMLFTGLFRDLAESFVTLFPKQSESLKRWLTTSPERIELQLRLWTGAVPQFKRLSELDRASTAELAEDFLSIDRDLVKGRIKSARQRLALAIQRETLQLALTLRGVNFELMARLAEGLESFGLNAAQIELIKQSDSKGYSAAEISQGVLGAEFYDDLQKEDLARKIETAHVEANRDVVVAARQLATEVLSADQVVPFLAGRLEKNASKGIGMTVHVTTDGPTIVFDDRTFRWQELLKGQLKTGVSYRVVINRAMSPVTHRIKLGSNEIADITRAEKRLGVRPPARSEVKGINLEAIEFLSTAPEVIDLATRLRLATAADEQDRLIEALANAIVARKGVGAFKGLDFYAVNSRIVFPILRQLWDEHMPGLNANSTEVRQVTGRVMVVLLGSNEIVDITRAEKRLGIQELAAAGLLMTSVPVAATAGMVVTPTGTVVTAGALVEAPKTVEDLVKIVRARKHVVLEDLLAGALDPKNSQAVRAEKWMALFDDLISFYRFNAGGAAVRSEAADLGKGRNGGVGLDSATPVDTPLDRDALKTVKDLYANTSVFKAKAYNAAVKHYLDGLRPMLDAASRKEIRAEKRGLTEEGDPTVNWTALQVVQQGTLTDREIDAAFWAATQSATGNESLVKAIYGAWQLYRKARRPSVSRDTFAELNPFFTGKFSEAAKAAVSKELRANSEKRDVPMAANVPPLASAIRVSTAAQRTPTVVGQEEPILTASDLSRVIDPPQILSALTEAESVARGITTMDLVGIIQMAKQKYDDGDDTSMTLRSIKTKLFTVAPEDQARADEAFRLFSSLALSTLRAEKREMTLNELDEAFRLTSIIRQRSFTPQDTNLGLRVRAFENAYFMKNSRPELVRTLETIVETYGFPEGATKTELQELIRSLKTYTKEQALAIQSEVLEATALETSVNAARTDLEGVPSRINVRLSGDKKKVEIRVSSNDPQFVLDANFVVAVFAFEGNLYIRHLVRGIAPQNVMIPKDLDLTKLTSGINTFPQEWVLSEEAVTRIEAPSVRTALSPRAGKLEMTSDKALEILSREVPGLALEDNNNIADFKVWNAAAKSKHQVSHAFWNVLKIPADAKPDAAGLILGQTDTRYQKYTDFFNSFDAPARDAEGREIVGFRSLRDIITDKATTSDEREVLLLSAVVSLAEIEGAGRVAIKTAIDRGATFDEMRAIALALAAKAKAERLEEAAKVKAAEAGRAERRDVSVSERQLAVAKWVEQNFTKQQVRTAMETTREALKAMGIPESELKTPALKVAVALTEGIARDNMEALAPVIIAISLLVDERTITGLTEQLQNAVPNMPLPISGDAGRLVKVIEGFKDPKVFLALLKFNLLLNPNMRFDTMVLGSGIDAAAVRQVLLDFAAWANKIHRPAFISQVDIRVFDPQAHDFNSKAAEFLALVKGKGYVLTGTANALSFLNLSFVTGVVVREADNVQGAVSQAAVGRVAMRGAQKIWNLSGMTPEQMADLLLKMPGFEKEGASGLAITKKSIDGMLQNMQVLFEAFQRIASAA